MYESNCRLLILGGGGWRVSLCSPSWPQMCIHWVLVPEYTHMSCSTVFLICNRAINFKSRAFKGAQTWGILVNYWDHPLLPPKVLTMQPNIMITSAHWLWRYALHCRCLSAGPVGHLLCDSGQVTSSLCDCFLSYNLGLMLLLLLSMVLPHRRMQLYSHQGPGIVKCWLL